MKRLEKNLCLGSILSISFILIVSCGKDPIVTPNPPNNPIASIASFVAKPTVVGFYQSADLSWSTLNASSAKEVTLNGVSVGANSTKNTGPLIKDTTFVFRVDSDSRTITITVTPPDSVMLLLNAGGRGWYKLKTEMQDTAGVSKWRTHDLGPCDVSSIRVFWDFDGRFRTVSKNPSSCIVPNLGGPYTTSIGTDGTKYVTWGSRLCTFLYLHKADFQITYFGINPNGTKNIVRDTYVLE